MSRKIINREVKTMTKRIYKMQDNEKHYVAHQTLGGFASTTNPNDAKVFNLENDSDKKLHDFIVNNYDAISEETLENNGWVKVGTPVIEKETVKVGKPNYRIKTTDGVVVRKVATRPYNQALIYRKNNKVYAGSMTTGKFNKNTLNWYLENGYNLEQVIAEVI